MQLEMVFNILLFIYLLVPHGAAQSPLIKKDVAFSAMQDLELDLGSSYGLSPWNMDKNGIAQGTVQNVMSGAQKRNPESLYFLGLLRLYGQGGLPEDHEKGVATIREAAELGHLEAQSAMGMLLLHGIGVNMDEKEAIIWLKKAVDNNDREACWILGKLLFEKENKKEISTGIGGSYGEAVALVKRAASKGAKEGYYHIALMHEYGKGLPRDYPAAVKLYRQSSNLGYIPALYNLGLMYAYGRGVTQNYREAYNLFQDAASKNHAPSMYYCGVFAMNGHGIPIDYNQATLWFDQAAQLGDPLVSAKAATSRDELRASIEHANKVNQAMLEKYAVNSERDSDVGGSGLRSEAFVMIDVDEAEEEVDAAMRQARKSRDGDGG